MSLLPACSTPKQPLTLGDIDIVGSNSRHAKTSSVSKSNEEIRKAYAKYLKHSTKNDKSRLIAIARLAELEFDLLNKTGVAENNNSSITEQEQNEAAIAVLNKTIELITVSLREHPKSKGNDKLLYNLANAYDQQGMSEKSLIRLIELSKNYPKSRYYIESQFRIAENYFSKGDYISAEDTYTNVIFSKDKSNRFIEKSYLKRGWAKFKQEFYDEAIDDYLKAVVYHGFDDNYQFSETEEDIFNEYFRAIGLAFINLGKIEDVNLYFDKKNDFKYIYQVYSSMQEIYSKQFRYTDAVQTLDIFGTKYPASRFVPESKIKIIDIWRKAGFPKKTYDAIDSFYLTYNPGSNHWKTQKLASVTQKKIAPSLKEHILLMTTHFHNKYQNKPDKPTLTNAKKWYRRYLKHYSQQSRKDKVHFLYAELLSENNNIKEAEEALYHYEISAYDLDIILDKEAAYNTILISSRLYKNQKKKTSKSKWLNKHIKYATLYNQLYPNDLRSPGIATHAAELAFSAKQYNSAIELTRLISEKADSSIIDNSRIIRAQAFVELKQYRDAENIYQSIVNTATPAYIKKLQIKDKLAFSIYQQGVIANNNKNQLDAIKNLRRVAKAAPQSNIAAVGLDEAISLSINSKMWEESISLIKEFQTQFPKHKLNRDMSKKLSMVYLKSGNSIAAAKEYEKISRSNQNRKTKIAALWKAAELYEANKETELAIQAYATFSKTFTDSYPQQMEAMLKLTSLHTSENSTEEANQWRRNILNSDKKIAKKKKTTRTKFIASTAALMLAKEKFEIYKELKLTLPLKESLLKKKKYLQQAVKLFGKASVYSLAETKTEAIHKIAEIYNTFSQDLLKSERPTNLDTDALEQYEILLEDQAFPFEEKAIEFYETNLLHIKDGLYDAWVRLSLDKLKILFPARYQRDVKMDLYINVLH